MPGRGGDPTPLPGRFPGGSPSGVQPMPGRPVSAPRNIFLPPCPGGRRQARGASHLPDLSPDRTGHRTNGTTSSLGEANRPPDSPLTIALLEVLAHVRPPKRDKTASTPASPECYTSLRPRLVAHLPRTLERGLDVSPVLRRHTRPPPLYGCGWCGRVWSLVRISLVPVLVA